ncbi:SMC family ATPase [Actinacidiphila sp. ITFR-21]|uniref:SMC family ATPase n=1 Tax=Actinacidiphila sp. ITFR-21 TaxID=3075199 RepID=UPI00288A2FD1|nr:SMC family ATPase [Streptomyces sp. ITFR-21]WNI14208.1 SMC family ATPase [Streptomyces sp. ITFR-21]
MRLHRLELTAFGPFAGTQQVDFDELSAAGLFLLHGPTGAGKTSVLDAVCYALYGQVPGVRPTTRLRSDHAAAGTATKVVLELTLGGRRLEITRQPEQLRAKRRGTGTTVDRAVTLLREHTGGQWQGLSRSHQEVGEEIGQLVGMTCEQFCQVVLLPQGEFATFLRAGATDRAALLGRLFDTRRFRGVEKWLRDRKQEAAQRVARGDAELRDLAARLSEAAGSAQDAGPGPDLLAWAAVLRCDAREAAAIAGTALADAEAAHHAAEISSNAARDLHALQSRHAEARRRAAAAESDRPARDAARALLARAHRARAVEPALALRDKAATQDAESAAVERTLYAELAAAGEPPAAGRLPQARTADSSPGAPAPSGAPRPPSAAGRSAVRGAPAPYDDGRIPGTRSPSAAGEALARRAGEVREELGGLALAVELEARARELDGRRAELERDERADDEILREADTWLEAWPAERDRLRAGVARGIEAGARAGALAAREETARRRHAAAAERDRLAAERDRAADAARRARDVAAEARERWHDLREARIDGIAAELAGQLVPGAPCRVCGSPEHPAPARPAGGQVTRADEEAAESAYHRAAAAHDAVRAEHTRLDAALAAAVATAGEESAARLAAACAELAAEHARAAREAADVSEAQRALARAEEERDRRAEQRNAALSATAARASRREELDGQYERLTAELTRARGGHPSVDARRARLTERIVLLDRAADAARDRAESAARLAEAETALAEAAARAGFASPAEAEAGLLPEEQLWRAERRVEEWTRQEAAVAADLAAPEPAAAARRPPADPVAARAALAAATDRLRTASAAESAAADRCRTLDRLSAHTTARVRGLGPARAEFDRIAHLADLASAGSAENRFRMELETYVLAARLEQVAAAAGVRLQRMSAGRYTLVHSDARGSGRTKSGLGLMVVDAWTGTERDTATLSGGETFFASLALALGLADVVTDESGGTRLDTLFIDEGFGSLDDQTLDEVLDVLDGLRERDRAVGIVSHVADLRHRIPAQLSVLKNRNGSTVRLRTAAGARG